MERTSAGIRARIGCPEAAAEIGVDGSPRVSSQRTALSGTLPAVYTLHSGVPLKVKVLTASNADG